MKLNLRRGGTLSEYTCEITDELDNLAGFLEFGQDRSFRLQVLIFFFFYDIFFSPFVCFIRKKDTYLFIYPIYC